MIENRTISNNSYIVKSLNKMRNTLQRDIDITWFTQKMGYVHIEIASPFITIPKYEGIQPAATPLHFLFIVSQSIPDNRRDCLQC